MNHIYVCVCVWGRESVCVCVCVYDTNMTTPASLGGSQRSPSFHDKGFSSPFPFAPSKFSSSSITLGNTVCVLFSQA